MHARKDYRKPTMPMIGAGADKLYALEDKRDELIKQCAKEQGRIMGFNPEAQYWTHCLPEQLASLLEGFDSNASALAAIAWLEKRGYTVTEPAHA